MGGTITYLHHDQQGATRVLTGSTGAVTGSTTFDAYGNKTSATGIATTPLGYDAQYTRADTGLTYLRARSYDAATAQFLAVDPAAAVTRDYVYAGNEPLSQADPAGLAWLGVSWLPSPGEALSFGARAGATLLGNTTDGQVLQLAAISRARPSVYAQVVASLAAARCTEPFVMWRRQTVTLAFPSLAGAEQDFQSG